MTVDLSPGPNPDAEPDEPVEVHRVREAYEQVGEALAALSCTDPNWRPLQEQYFALKARILALDPVHQNVDLPGTHVGGSYASFRVMDNLRVADPDNPHVSHAVTLDHVITNDEVRFEVNAVPLEAVGERSGSHIR